MSDLLVRLYDQGVANEAMELPGLRVFRPMTPDRTAVVAFVRDLFGEHWASECETAFFDHPVRMWVVADGERLVGFGCYECTNKGFFGPTGVDPAYRGRGIGRVILLRCLGGLKELGYAYAVIGGVEQKNFGFYAKVCGATPIPDSETSIYRDLLSTNG